MPQIFRSALSRQDYDDIWDYIARDDAEAASRFLRKIDEKLLLYAAFPGMGTRRDNFSPGLRSFPVGNYIVFYRAMDDGIELVRVLRGSQRLRRHFRS